ncbi:MAG: poly-gamma-glutamate hydrolase family protein [Pseudomonadales bacterium]
MDIYTSFQQLHEEEGAEAYEIALRDRQSHISIIAPHGGNIEPGTTELAKLTAGTDFNFYSFIARKPQNSPDLHITSHRFDEPRCLALLARSRHVITVHGFKFDRPMIYLGGLDELLKTQIFRSLQAADLPVADNHPKYQGINPRNICNRSQTGMGVQLEISRHLRGCDDARRVIARAIQTALLHHNPSPVGR